MIGDEEILEALTASARLGNVSLESLVPAVRALVATSLANAEADDTRVEVYESREGIKRAKVWRNGVLIFDGVSIAALVAGSNE